MVVGGLPFKINAAPVEFKTSLLPHACSDGHCGHCNARFHLSYFLLQVYNEINSININMLTVNINVSYVYIKTNANLIIIKTTNMYY